MIDLPFDPDLVVGAVRVSWHSLFGLLALVGGAAAGIALARPRASFDEAYAVALVGIVGGLVGSRLFHVVDEWPRYAGDPGAILAVWNGGASITGGIVGGVLAGALTARRVRAPVGAILDAGVVGLAFGMAIGRIGDIVNGEHHAAACAGLPWCVRYTHPNTLGQRDYVHPAVAYELLLDLAIAATLLALRRRGVLRDRLVFAFLGLYGAARLALGTVRLDPPFALGLTQAELVAIVFVLVAFAGILATARKAHIVRAHGGR